MQLIQNDLIQEVEQVMKNLEAVLKAANMNFMNVVKSTIFIDNMDNFETVNSIYGKYFKKNSKWKPLDGK